ncbi:MAG: hypothetical protein JXA28_03205 [Bacteroidetes bacterium]|nr:hypothetical protein [Bacteroidota bacterium]
MLVDLIIDRAVECARRHINWLVWHRGYHTAPTGLSVDDLAYDLIAELVSELDGTILGRLMQALRSVTAGQEEDADLESAFISVVNRTVRLNLVRVFIEINPLQARLLRALRRYVANSAEIRRIESVGGFWYAAAHVDPLLHLPAVSQDFLRSALIPTRLDGNPVRSVLHAALDAVASLTDVRRAVDEHDIIEITLSLLHSHHQVELVDSVTQPAERNDPATACEIADALEAVRVRVREKYVDRGKLSPSEGDAMIGAMTLYMEDLQRDDVLGHFSYLRQTMPGLTHRRYRMSYRNTYEYIVRTVFTTLRRRLE